MFALLSAFFSFVLLPSLCLAARARGCSHECLLDLANSTERLLSEAGFFSFSCTLRRRVSPSEEYRRLALQKRKKQLLFF